jgi:hypothetical protein
MYEHLARLKKCDTYTSGITRRHTHVKRRLSIYIQCIWISSDLKQLSDSLQFILK